MREVSLVLPLRRAICQDLAARRSHLPYGSASRPGVHPPKNTSQGCTETCGQVLLTALSAVDSHWW